MKLCSLLFCAALWALAPGTAVAQTAPPRPYVVVVAPGHGGEDPGAVYPPNSRQPELLEKDLTLPIALKLRDRLQTQEVRVVMTRTSDVTTTAQQRAALAEQVHADLFVAVHVNSFYPDASVRGVEAQFFSDPDLAENLADGLVRSLRDFPITVRTTKDREEDNILSMPGVIVEAGYLSNPADRQLVQSPAFQDAIADGVYQGMLKYAPQIEELKAEMNAYRLVQAQAAAKLPLPAAGPRVGLPSWLALVGIAGALSLVLVRVRAGGRRRRVRRRPAYGRKSTLRDERMWPIGAVDRRASLRGVVRYR